ncbi:MAG: zinc ABC transporter substrate-binding protein [Spirochaetales bacterium]|nr:zinc ABC transporter substrate-binding protein [Spirochaetales bacterium]
MKKIMIVILAIFSILIVSCSKSDNNTSEKLILVGVNFPSYDLLRTLNQGTENSVSMLLPPGSESHSYEPTPQDIIKLSKSDLFVYTGGESDEWVNKVMGSLGTKLETFKLIEAVPSVLEAHSEAMEGEAEEEIDEHVWTSLENEKLLASKLAIKLGQIDTKNAELYQENAKAFSLQLDALIAEADEVIANGKRKVIVFADRFPLSHFVNEFNLEFYAAFPGCVHESEASAKTVAFLIEKVKEEKLPIVFHIELSDSKLAKLISEETGCKVGEWNTAHNLTREQFDSGITYLDLFKQDLALLKEALN